MIPFAILSGQLYKNEQESLEIRILELAPDGFTFRLSNKTAECMTADRVKICLQFYCREIHGYHRVMLDEAKIEKIETTEYFSAFSVKTKDNAYKESAMRLSKEYLSYIRLKMDEEDREVSYQMTGYPAQLENRYETSFQKQKCGMFQDRREEKHKKLLEILWKRPFEFGIHLDHPRLWEAYLKMPIDNFLKNYFEKDGLQDHPAAKRRPELLYIGSQICSHLVPDDEMIRALSSKARRDKMRLVLVFPPLNETKLESADLLLARLRKHFFSEEKLELVVNDWGMLQLLRDRNADCFSVTLGTMLVKAKKDVRQIYLETEGRRKKLWEWPATFRKMLEEEYHVSRYSVELSNQVRMLPGTPCGLHMPFYQMNTSAFCTLLSTYRYGDRGRQEPSELCSFECENYLFLYPKMLNMVGKYNSLYGCAWKSLWDDEWLEKSLNQGVDRIVWNLLQ